MQYVNSILNRVFDLALDPFSGMSPWAGMCAISLLASVLVLLVFRACSDRSLIKRRKGKFVARVLELALFRQDVVVNLGSFGRVLAANFWYLAALLRPLLVSIVPLLLVLVQVHSFFANRPLRVGETALIKARLPAELPIMDQSLSAPAASGVTIESPPVRIPALNEVVWRLRAVDNGAAWVEIGVNGETIRKSVQIGERRMRTSSRRVRGGLLDETMYPEEAPLPPGSPVVSIDVSYPDSELVLWGIHIHWLLAHFVLVLVFALILKRPMRVVV